MPLLEGLHGPLKPIAPPLPPCPHLLSTPPFGPWDLPSVSWSLERGPQGCPSPTASARLSALSHPHWGLLSLSPSRTWIRPTPPGISTCVSCGHPPPQNGTDIPDPLSELALSPPRGLMGHRVRVRVRVRVRAARSPPARLHQQVLLRDPYPLSWASIHHTGLSHHSLTNLAGGGRGHSSYLAVSVFSTPVATRAGSQLVPAKQLFSGTMSPRGFPR